MPAWQLFGRELDFMHGLPGWAREQSTRRDELLRVFGWYARVPVSAAETVSSGYYSSTASQICTACGKRLNRLLIEHLLSVAAPGKYTLLAGASSCRDCPSQCSKQARMRSIA